MRTELRKLGVGDGPWRDSSAEHGIKEIATACEAVLREQIRSLDTFEVVVFAASMLGASQDAQFENRIRSHESAQHALATNFHSENALASRVILEMALREPLTNGMAVGRDASKNLALLAHQLWRWRLLADRLTCDLCSVPYASLSRDGTFDIAVADRPPFHLSEYLRVSIERMTARDRSEEDGDLAIVQGWMGALLNGEALPAELIDIDRGLHLARGYGLTSVAGVLQFLHQWAYGSDAKAAGTRSTRLSRTLLK